MDDLSFDATAADAMDDAPAASMDAAEAAAEIPDVAVEQSVPGLEATDDANAAPQFDPAAADGATSATDAAGGADTPTDAAGSSPPTDQPALGTTHLRPGGLIEVPPSPDLHPTTIELGHGPKPPKGWSPGGPEAGG